MESWEVSMEAGGSQDMRMGIPGARPLPLGMLLKLGSDALWWVEPCTPMQTQGGFHRHTFEFKGLKRSQDALPAVPPQPTNKALDFHCRTESTHDWCTKHGGSGGYRREGCQANASARAGGSIGIRLQEAHGAQAAHLLRMHALLHALSWDALDWLPHGHSACTDRLAQIYS